MHAKGWLQVANLGLPRNQASLVPISENGRAIVAKPGTSRSINQQYTLPDVSSIISRMCTFPLRTTWSCSTMLRSSPTVDRHPIVLARNPAEATEETMCHY